MNVFFKLVDRCCNWLMVWGAINSEVLGAMNEPASKSLAPHKAA